MVLTGKLATRIV